MFKMKLDICLLVFASALYWNPIETSKLFNIIREYPAYLVNTVKYFRNGPDLIANTVEMIMQQKYLVESHNITTKDGYIIQLHRFPHQGSVSPIKTPVLLHHGSFGASALWVLNKPHQSLGYLLADKGHDVWLSNVRGNKYGRQHKTLDPNKKEFWKFSWDPIAQIDLADIIDYVLRTTSNDKLNLIAHSLGAAQAFALLSTNETYNDKVKHIFALAPEVNFTHVRSNTAKLLTKLYPAVLKLLEILNIYELDLPKILHDKTFGLFPRTLSVILNNINMLHLFGVTYSDVDFARYPLYYSHLISGTSIYVFGQTLQVAKSNRFGCFDWGEKVNQDKYGQTRPPDYDVSKVKVGVTLYYGLDDDIVSVESVDELEKTLPNVAGKFQFGGKHFKHFDFFTSAYVGKEYQKLIDKL